MRDKYALMVIGFFVGLIASGLVFQWRGDPNDRQIASISETAQVDYSWPNGPKY